MFMTEPKKYENGAVYIHVSTFSDTAVYLLLVLGVTKNLITFFQQLNLDTRDDVDVCCIRQIYNHSSSGIITPSSRSHFSVIYMVVLPFLSHSCR